jgi:hypothetical protein
MTSTAAARREACAGPFVKRETAVRSQARVPTSVPGGASDTPNRRSRSTSTAPSKLLTVTVAGQT